MNPRPSREDLLEMARAMVPRLRQKALQIERDRVIPMETHRAFQGAGFYKVFQPERFGGYEMPISMLVEIGSELGRGCGSSAWIFTNLATQNWIIGMHQPQAQEEVWGNNPDALCASSFPTQGGSGRYVDGGISLNGIWSFASGIDFVDWENLQVFIPKENGPPDHRFVLVPKRDFTIQDDWFVNGLSGTGSKSIVIKDVFVRCRRRTGWNLGWRSLRVLNPESSGVGAPDRRPRHDEGYHANDDSARYG